MKKTHKKEWVPGKKKMNAKKWIPKNHFPYFKK